MNRPAATPLRRDLATLAGEYRLGALLNAIEATAKRHESDVPPAATRRAATALWSMLADLDLTDAGTARAVDVWRPR